MVSFFFNEDIIGFYVSMNNIMFRYKLQSSCKLIGNFERFPLSQRTSFRNNILKIAIRAELENHRHIMLCKKAVKNASCEDIVNIWSFSELFKNSYFPTFVMLKILMICFILLPYCLMSFKERSLTAITLWLFTMTPL